MDKRMKTAQVEYSKEDRQLQITVPKGFKYEDVSALGERLLSQEILEMLLHGCGACLSGVPIVIREQFEHEVSVDLESMQIAEER